MRSISNKVLLQQAKDFFKEARYVPTNYDALFHTYHFSSPVTIRKHFGSWEEYAEKSFNSMVMDYPYKMFYGNHNRRYRVALPPIMNATFMSNGNQHDCLGSLSYDELPATEAYIVKQRWKGFVEVLDKIGINYTMIPAEKRFLTPYVVIEGEYAIASFDTPHMKNHYKRTTKVMEFLNQNYELLNLNGIKTNHLKSAVKRLLE